VNAPSKERLNVKYMLSIIQPTGGSISKEELDAIMADVDALRTELKDAGAWVFAGGLADPSTSTVVRANGDGVLTTDGPFAEGKEYVGGINVIEAADLDAALEWGRKLSRATTLAIEVRPFAHIE
jgi:hypothetical protein